MCAPGQPPPPLRVHDFVPTPSPSSVDRVFTAYGNKNVKGTIPAVLGKLTKLR